MSHSSRFSLPRLALLLALLLPGGFLHRAAAQTGVTIGATTAPDASAALDIVSSSKGVLLPRVAAATAIASPAPGLLVYQTGSPAGFYYNAGTAVAPVWRQVGTTASADNLGNHTATTNLGLNDNWLSNAAANANGLRIGNGGNATLSGRLGIGTSPLSTPLEKLEILDGSIRLTATGPAAVGIDNIRGSMELGLAANNGEYSDLAQAGDAVLRSNGKRLVLAGRDGGSVLVSTGATGSEAERLRVTTTGNVGIGTTAPLTRLSIGQVTGQGNTAGQNLGELSFVGFNRPNASASIQALSKDYDDTGHLLFKTSPNGGGAVERLRITADGNVGVGVVAPTQKLDVNGGILARANGLIGNQGAHLQWNRSGGDGETWLLNQQGGGPGGLRFGASNSVSSGSNTITEWARFDGGGDLGLGTAGTDPAASAQLELRSSSKGLLPPRLDKSQRDAIAAPATGLLLYNTSAGKLNTWNGSTWDAALSATEQPSAGTSQNYLAPGQYSYTVPAGVRRLSVEAVGAQGGNGGYPGSTSSQGARVQATLVVVPGEVLTVVVGGAGRPSNNGGGGGYNGGGNGSSGYNSGGGGGATDLRRNGTALTDRILVAAGGGGSGYENPQAGESSVGGAGGAPNGGNGNAAIPGASNSAGGTGATQGGGGSAGGTLGQGGNGATNGSGGGGGGYYGGGGSPNYGGGGGGSSYVTPTGSDNVQLTAGFNAGNNGNGALVITPGLAYAAPTLDGTNFTSVASTNGLLARGSDIVDEQGAYLQWNRSGNQGETWLLNQQGGGPGGIRFGSATTSNTVTEWGRFDNNGRFGLGTTSPIAPLHVKGAATASTGGGGFSFFSPGSGLTATGTSAGVNKPVTAYFEGGEVWVSGYIVASSLQTTSDRRIKHVVGLSDRATDLALLNRLRITDYTYIDQVNNAPGVVKKVIAQEVEEVLPTAVSRSTQALPNVYERATRISYANGYVTVTTAKPHDLPAPGGRMRFYTPANESLDPEVTVVDAHTVRFASPEAHAAGLFVYGKYVDDFRSVDYDALTTLNVSATQELARKVAALEKQNGALQAQVATATAQAMATTEAFEARLRRLEAGEGQARK